MDNEALNQENWTEIIKSREGILLILLVIVFEIFGNKSRYEIMIDCFFSVIGVLVGLGYFHFSRELNLL